MGARQPRKKALPTPFATVAQAVADQGYKVIPIMPDSKSPGTCSMGQWRPMLEWQQHRDKPLGQFDIKIWGGWEDANIGVVLGNQVAEGWEVGALDFDTDDYSLLELMESAVPESPVKKRGRRGFTGFYLMPHGTKGRRFKRGAATLCEILTGNGTRQTVIPPSIHPETGKPYEWMTRQTLSTLGAIHLPRLTEDMLEKFVDTLEHITGVTEAVGPAATGATFEEGSPHNVLNTTALHRLAEWVPQLGLSKLKRTSAGFVAIPHWRANRKGWGDDQRNPSLAFSDHGIRDMSADTPHSPLDVVMMANGWDLDTSYMWLAQRLGMWIDDDGEWAELSAPKESQVVAEALPPHDPVTGEIAGDVPSIAELPPAVEDLTQIPGLLGDVVDWIVDTARQPNRVLALGAAITLIGTLMGRRVAGPTMSGTHLYVIALAPSGAGKDHALKQVARLLKAANAGHLVGPSSFMSMSALIGVLKRSPCALCPMDEFGAFLAKLAHPKATSHEQGITATLREAWGSSFESIRTPEYAATPSEEIASPALSTYGVSTPGEFFDALRAADVLSGFLNRFLMMQSDTSEPDREPKADKFKMPAELKAALAAFHAVANRNTAEEVAGFRDESGPPIIMPWADAEAAAEFTRLREIVAAKRKDADQDPFYARTVEMALRLATIRAGGQDLAGGVSVADMKWGGDVALMSAGRMFEVASEHMAANDYERHCNTIARIIKAARGTVPHWKIAKGMRSLKPKDLDDALAGMVGQHRIIEISAPPRIGAGRPSDRKSYALPKG